MTDINIDTTKELFLKKIGLDKNNLPSSFHDVIGKYEYLADIYEQAYLWSDDLSMSGFQYFSIKDVIGTKHPKYFNLSWIEAFLAAKREYVIIKKYYENPKYYEEIKQLDQQNVCHDGSIELAKVNGKYIVFQGNNRVFFLKTMFFAEMAQASTKEEKETIERKYVFAAKTRILPSNHTITKMIYLLKEKNPKIKIRNLNFSLNSCEYEIEDNGSTLLVNNYEELENFFRERYFSLEAHDLETIYSLLIDYFSFYIQSPTEIKELLEYIYPFIASSAQTFLATRRILPNYKILEMIDFPNSSFETICQSLPEILDKLNLNGAAPRV